MEQNPQTTNILHVLHDKGSWLHDKGFLFAAQAEIKLFLQVFSIHLRADRILPPATCWASLH